MMKRSDYVDENLRVSGALIVSPTGPEEWSVAFFPSNYPNGAMFFLERTHLLTRLESLGVSKETIEFIRQFDFTNDDLETVEIALKNLPIRTLYRCGLISGRLNFLGQETDR